MNGNKNSGMPAVILAGVCWGMISIFVRALSGRGLDSLEIVTLRTCLSGVLLLLFLLVSDRKALRIELKDIWMFLGSGVLSLTFFSLCYFTTIVNIGTAIAVVLLYTSPIFVMLFSAVFFKEKITGKKVIALVMTFAGCVLVAGLAGGSTMALTPKAFMIGIGAGVGYALYSVFAGFAVKKYSSLTVTMYTFLFSGISLMVLKNPVSAAAKLDGRSALFLLGIAIICTVVPYIAYTFGLQNMEKSKAAVLVTVEPLVGTLLGFFAYGEEAGFGKIIGIILIFGAVLMLSVGDKE